MDAEYQCCSVLSIILLQEAGGVGSNPQMATASPRILTRPTPGYYRLSLVPRAWKVPALLFYAGSDVSYWSAYVDGENVGRHWSEQDLEAEAAQAISEGELFKHPLLRIVLFGETSDEPTYRYLLSLKDWARLHRLNHPCLHPLRPMDPLTDDCEDF